MWNAERYDSNPPKYRCYPKQFYTELISLSKKGASTGKNEWSTFNLLIRIAINFIFKLHWISLQNESFPFGGVATTLKNSMLLLVDPINSLHFLSLVHCRYSCLEPVYMHNLKLCPPAVATISDWQWWDFCHALPFPQCQWWDFFLWKSYYWIGCRGLRWNFQSKGNQKVIHLWVFLQRSFAKLYSVCYNS